MKYRYTAHRLWGKVDTSTTPEGCWEWTASRRAAGYGQFLVQLDDGTRAPRGAHRLVYEALIGSVPEGLELDHLCRNPSCVNPAHLEAVTHAENVRRGQAGAANRAQTHCPAGHEYNEANTWMYEGRRYCRPCRSADSNRRYHERHPDAVFYGPRTVPS